MNLNIDLSKIRDPKKAKFDSITLGDAFTITTGENKNLQIKSGDVVIAEYKNGDWLLSGYSISSMWKCLENHYEALKQYLESK